MTVSESATRRAEATDAAAIGQLLHDFNREFNEPTPAPDALAARIRELLNGGDTLVLLAGAGPDGLAVLRFRLSIWSTGMECYLAELYIVRSVAAKASVGRSCRRQSKRLGPAAPTPWTSASTNPTSPPDTSTKASASATAAMVTVH
jgi:hypothetical protein